MDGGSGFSVASVLVDVVLASPRGRSYLCPFWRSATLSGARSDASLLLGLCVGDAELRTVSCESFKKKDMFGSMG
uniref:Uncharacterized protein n=1 Tax=Oryza glumipatula TaxID=40148 RepID=A0A0D9ZTN1_9ORYZ